MGREEDGRKVVQGEGAQEGARECGRDPVKSDE